MKVLDVGSGHQPYKKATHLSDFELGSNFHRAGAEAVVDERPFVVCSVEALPFKTQSLDFIYCSHVLEHVDDTRKAEGELKRIGKHGIAIFPAPFWEIMFRRHDKAHQWVINPAKNSRTEIVKHPLIYAIKYVLAKFWILNFRIKLREKLIPLCGRLGLREAFIHW